VYLKENLTSKLQIYTDVVEQFKFSAGFQLK